MPSSHISHLIYSSILYRSTFYSLQLRLQILKLRHILHAPRALTSRQTGLPRAHVLDEDSLLLFIVNNNLLLRALILLRSSSSRSKIQRRQNLLQQPLALLRQALNLLLRHTSRFTKVARHSAQDTLHVGASAEVEFCEAGGEGFFVDFAAAELGEGLREGGGEFLDVVVGGCGCGFALGDEVDGGFGAGWGGGVEVGAEEGLEVGLCEGFDVLNVAVYCCGLSVEGDRWENDRCNLTEIKIEGLRGNVVPQPAALLAQVLELLQTLVDETDLVLLKVSL